MVPKWYSFSDPHPEDEIHKVWNLGSVGSLISGLGCAKAKIQNLNPQRCARSEPRSDADKSAKKRNKHGRGRLTRELDKFNDFNLNELIGRDNRNN